MTAPEFFVFIAALRALTWLLQTNGLTRPLWDLHPKLSQLAGCDLCLGFWVALLLSFTLVADPFGLWVWWLERLVLAGLATITAHIIKVGWQTRFGVTIVR